MTILFLASFILGLLLAVRVMMYGVERPRAEHPEGERSFRLSPAIIVSFSIVFGAAGYVLTRHAVSTGVLLAVPIGLGILVSIVTARLVRKWWVVTPEHDIDDVRYVLQGHVARVTKPIRADVDGEVTYELEGARHVVRARSFDDAALSVGTEVVIERIEDDVAYVEPWMEVEKRL
jgi:membrane protein implicated in regulation of membrane protease activity